MLTQYLLINNECKMNDFFLLACSLDLMDLKIHYSPFHFVS